MKKIILFSTILILLFLFACQKEEGLTNNSTCPNCPTIESISPAEGVSGDTILIMGKNYDRFVEEGSVTISGIEAIVIESSPTQIRVEVPDDASSGKVVVCAKNPNLSRDNLLCSEEDPIFNFREIQQLIEGELLDTIILSSLVTTEGDIVLFLMHDTEYYTCTDVGVCEVTIRIIHTSGEIQDHFFSIRGKITSSSKTNDGGFIVSGYGTFFNEVKGLLYKFKSDGSLDWSSDFYFDYEDQPIIIHDAIQLKDGSYFAAGKSGLGNSDWMAFPYIISIDESGRTKDDWASGIEGDGIIVIEEFGIAIYNVIENNSGLFVAVGGKEFGGNGSWVIVFNSGGSKLNSYNIPDSNRSLNEIITTSDNTLLAIGSDFSFSSKSDIFLVKLSENGELINQTSYGGSKDDEGVSIVEKDNQFYIWGHTKSFGTFEDNYVGYFLGVESDLSESGSKEFATYSNLGHFKAKDIHLTQDGRFLITAKTPLGSYYAVIDENGNIN